MTESRSSVALGWGLGRGTVELFWGVVNVEHTDYVWLLECVILSKFIMHLKWVHFVLCKSYFNKVDF